MKINSVIKYSLISALCLLFVGCGSTIKPLQPVSVAPLSVIGGNVSKAKESAKQTVVAVKAGDHKTAIDSAVNTQAILEVAEKQVEFYKQEIHEKNKEITEHNEQLETLKADAANYKAAMWKRNWVILAMAAGLAALTFWIFKGPIMSAVGFIVRKFGGIPW